MEKSFDSPTTPGLKIDFKNYLIELVCINCDKRIGPRFWKNNIYWSSKYKREIRGVYNLIKSFDAPITEDTKVNVVENSPFAQKILIQVIKNLNIKSLSAKKTVQKIIANHKKIFAKEYDHRLSVANEKTINSEIVNGKENARYVDTGNKNKLSILKDIEENGEEE